MKPSFPSNSAHQFPKWCVFHSKVFSCILRYSLLSSILSSDKTTKLNGNSKDRKNRPFPKTGGLREFDDKYHNTNSFQFDGDGDECDDGYDDSRFVFSIVKMAQAII